MSNHGSPLDAWQSQIEQWVAEGMTNSEIVRMLALSGVTTSETAVRRAKKRFGISSPKKAGAGSRKKPAITFDGDSAEINSPTTDCPMTPEALMELHGLDPDEWEMDSPIVSWWGDPADPRYQMKLRLQRIKKVEFIVPARTDGAYKAPKKPKKKTSGSQLWVVAGDQQAPYHDRELHEAMCSFLDAVQPYGMVHTGDLIDLPTVSRWRDNPEWHVSAQECIDHGYLILRDYRRAAEDSHMVFLPGNHDIRIRTEILDRAERLYGIRKAAIPGEPTEESVLSLTNLLRLDELDIEYIDPNGNYEHAQFNISDHVAVRHGSKTNKNAAVATGSRLTHSIIIGHTHRQSIQHRTIYDINRDRHIVEAVETGALCSLDGGMGYTVDPDWVNGFVTVLVHPDGTHHIERALWDGESLHWRGERY